MIYGRRVYRRCHQSDAQHSGDPLRHLLNATRVLCCRFQVGQYRRTSEPDQAGSSRWIDLPVIGRLQSAGVVDRLRRHQSGIRRKQLARRRGPHQAVESISTDSRRSTDLSVHEFVDRFLHRDQVQRLRRRWLDPISIGGFKLVFTSSSVGRCMSYTAHEE